jgi:hypothetical protein
MSDGGGGPVPRNLAAVAPVRLAAWRQKEDGRVVVQRPRPDSRGLRGLLDRVSFHLSMPQIRLDAIGSLVWQQLDGRRTVSDVCAAVRGELGTAAEPVEERVGTFVGQLHKLELVDLPGVGDDPATPGAATGDP